MFYVARESHFLLALNLGSGVERSGQEVQAYGSECFSQVPSSSDGCFNAPFWTTMLHSYTSAPTAGSATAAPATATSATVERTNFLVNSSRFLPIRATSTIPTREGGVQNKLSYFV